MTSSASPPPPHHGWVVVIPVKHGARAKTRLAAFAGDQRRALARAMALDTVEAADTCPDVLEVLAVTSDPQAAEQLRELGVTVVPDSPEAGLNPALRHGAARARGRHPDVATAALSADIPALRENELSLALRAASAHPSSFVVDAMGVGTTLYCANHGAEFAPCFGTDSAAAHRAGGAIEISLDQIASVRRDVDTADDLRVALDLGVGPRTTLLTQRLRSR